MIALLSLIAYPFILFPFFLFLFVYFVFKKLFKKSNAFSKAADATTLLLFFSIPALTKLIWHFDLGFIVIILGIFIAMILTIVEWIKSKEIDLIKLFRKIWRLMFLILTFAYIGICLGAIIQKVIELY